MNKKCTICGHETEHHYLKDNGKIIWGWRKDKWGNKQRWCSCLECDEFDAIHGVPELLKEE